MLLEEQSISSHTPSRTSHKTELQSVRSITLGNQLTALPHPIFKGVSSPARNTNERFCHVGRKKKDWYEDDEQSSTLDRYSSYRIVLIECDSEVIIGNVEL